MKRWRNLSWQFGILVAGVTTLLLLVGGGVLLTLDYRSDREAAITTQHEVACRAADLVGRYIEERVHVLNVVAGSSVELSDELPVLLANITQNYPDLIEMVVLDGQGRVVGHTATQDALLDDPATMNRADWLETSLQDNIYLSKLFLSADAPPYMIMSSPIQDGTLLGMTAARLDVQILWDRMATISAGDTGVAYFLDANRVIIGHSESAVVLAQQQQPSGLVEQGGVYQNINGQSVVGASCAIAGTTWTAVAELPVDEAYIDTSESQRRVWGLYLVLVLILTALLGWLLARRVLFPIRQFATGVYRIRQGDLEFRLNSTRKDEIGDLARAFDAMTEQLHSRTREVMNLNQSLEGRVQERTRELQEATIRMEAIADALYYATERANAANDAKNQFLANMSHELRTPLSSLILYHDLLLRGAYGELNAQQRDRLNKSLLSAKHLLELVTSVLDLTKVEAREMPVKKVETDIRPVLESSSEILAPLIQSDDVQFSMDIMPNLPPILGDQQRVQQVVTHLLSNAAKFTASGEIILSAQLVHLDTRGSPMPGLPPMPKGDWVVVSVKDTGIGIAEEHLQVIFEPFRQVDESNTREYGGAGLGLALCQRIVEAQNGYIGVESTLWKGSTFSFALRAILRGG